ncbi:MAG: hypothetical protein IID12_09520 [Candidatus Marinimicrobia bacterium]|nr:hypothetical protein [Candidatus Neomarinimicrobiota bacterium]
MSDSPKRKLAAIMFTDMVGYTALMQEDEDKARELIERHRDLMKPHVDKHDGEIIQFVGDGTFCRFNSAIEAVNAAIEIQHVFKLEDEMSLRIGIHVGDVVVKGDEVYGDGVNIASRLEPLAEPGGICLSGEVYTQIKNQAKIDLIAGGSKNLKNVKDPVDIYFVSASTGEKRSFSGETLISEKSIPRKFIYAGATVMALLLVVVWNLPFFSSGDRVLEASGEIRSIAVLPLDNLTNDPDQEYFSDGMTEALIANIAKIRSLKVISRTSVMRYKGTEKPLPEIGKELNVDAILEGSVMHAEGEVRITVQLIRASTDEHLWADSYTDKLENIMILQSRIAKAIAKEVKLTLSPEEELKLSSNKKIDPAAHEAFLRGKHFWNKRTGDDIKKGLEYFKEAVNIEPLYALAHVGIAESYVLLHQYANLPSRETYPKGKAAALKALEIDPNLGEAHIAIAYALTEHFWDWEAAEAEYKKGLELSPNYATGHQWYAEYLNYMGRHDESKKEIKIARELDPLSLVILWVESWIYHWSGDIESARRFMDRNIELYPDFSQMYYNKGDLHLGEGEYEEAAQLYLKGLEIDKVSAEVLDEHREAFNLYGIKGLFNVFLEFDLKQDPINSYRVARDYYILGDYEKSIDWFERAIEDRIFWIVQINQRPTFSDPVFRSNPRFQAILKKMNFPDI